MDRRRKAPVPPVPEDLFTPGEWEQIVEVLQLSPREGQILRAAMDGLKDGDAAERLGITVCTIRSHFSALHRRFNVTNRAALLVRVFKTHRMMHSARDSGPSTTQMSSGDPGT